MIGCLDVLSNWSKQERFLLIGACDDATLA
jgi:hypothetical protein